MKQSLGLIEVRGLSTAVVTADAMVKTANVSLLNLENTRGLGWITVMISGDVGAVTAAINAGKQISMNCGHYITSKVIARPIIETEEISKQPQKAEKPEANVEKPKKAKRSQTKVEELKKAEKPQTKAEHPKEAEKPEVKAEEPKKAEKPEVKAEQPKEAEKPEAKAEQPKEAEKPEAKAEQPKEAEKPEVKAEAYKQTQLIEDSLSSPPKPPKSKKRNSKK